MNKWLEAAKVVRAAMDMAGAFLTDEQAAEVPALYRAWEPDASYVVGDRRLYDGILYTCLMEHDSNETWNPADSTSLWSKVLTSDTGKILPWEQPDSTNPYMAGDKVTHNNQTWISDVDDNVWEPGVYGWVTV